MQQSDAALAHGLQDDVAVALEFRGVLMYSADSCKAALLRLLRLLLLLLLLLLPPLLLPPGILRDLHQRVHSTFGI